MARFDGADDGDWVSIPFNHNLKPCPDMSQDSLGVFR